MFHGGEAGAHRYLLFNLKDDLSEANNLAATKPELVQELDALIEDFLKKTNAVVPALNPSFDPTKYQPELEGKRPPNKSNAKRAGQASARAENETTAKKPAASEAAMKGWKARVCSAEVKDGSLIVSQLSDASFLGFSAAKHSGRSVVRMRIKAAPGASRVDWLPGGVQSKPRSVPFEVKGNDWQIVSVEIPTDSDLGIVRIYLPNTSKSEHVEIDWIEIESLGTSRMTRSDF